MVVDHRGVVQAAWVGKLSASQETEVFRAVKTQEPPRSKRPASLDDSMTPVHADELRALLKDPNTVVLDIRERSRFYEAHVHGSLNMPMDEIVPRAPHELPQDRTILLYCFEYLRPQTECETVLCEPSRRALEYTGITKVRLIAGGITALKQAGIPVDMEPRP